jgi:hypothetical protein
MYIWINHHHSRNKGVYLRLGIRFNNSSRCCQSSDHTWSINSFKMIQMTKKRDQKTIKMGEVISQINFQLICKEETMMMQIPLMFLTMMRQTSENCYFLKTWTILWPNNI